MLYATLNYKILIISENKSQFYRTNKRGGLYKRNK